MNRVSLGVQALDDADLKALGRMHTVSEALRARSRSHSGISRAPPSTSSMRAPARARRRPGRRN